MNATRIHSCQMYAPRETNLCDTRGNISQQLLEYFQRIIVASFAVAGVSSIELDTYFASPQSTGKRSALGTIREAELYGGVLSSSLSREHLALTAEFLRGDEYVLRPNSLPHF
jgi:hypothetical protein